MERSGTTNRKVRVERVRGGENLGSSITAAREPQPYSSSPSSSVTASVEDKTGTALPAKMSDSHLRISASVIGFGGRPLARLLAGCRVSHLDRTCFRLPLPGV